MTVLPIEPLTIAQCVFLRPKMYTANGTLSEVIALFNGYDRGVRSSAGSTADDSPTRALQWLAEKCRFNEHGLSGAAQMPAVQLEVIMKCFSTEQQVFDSMFTFLKNRLRPIE